MAKKLSISFNQLSFDLETGVNGSIIHVVMRELDGASRNRYMEFVNKNVTRDADGKPTGMKSWKSQQTHLLSMCLFPAKLHEDGTPLSETCGADDEAEYVIASDAKPFNNETLSHWPDKALQVLSRTAIALSGLNESPDEAGNV